MEAVLWRPRNLSSHTPCLDLAVYHGGESSPVEVGRGGEGRGQVLEVGGGGDGGAAAGRRARHLLLRALWHQVKGAVVVVVVVVVGCEMLAWLLQNAWHAWGYTGRAWEHARCRSLPPRIAGCVSGLLLVTVTGRRGKKKGSCPGRWVTPDTQSSQFVASRTISRACMPRNIKTTRPGYWARWTCWEFN